jgi:antirestriction protein ArdC
MTTKTDELFEGIVLKLISTIESGNHGEWTKPWTTLMGANGLGINAKTEKAYRGFNQFILLMTTAMEGYGQNVWATYKQYQALGGQVRKGETGVQLVKWGRTYSCDECDHKGKYPCGTPDHESSVRMWASPFTVFNIAQQDGFEIELPDLGTGPERIEAVEKFIAGTGAEITWVAQNRAYYNRLDDKITLPLVEQFDSPQGYYGTALHELTHWTGAEHRLDRPKGKVFGDESYAGEELVAELGSTFLSARFGVETDPHPEHANYLASWLKALKEDPRALYRAAAAAQQAVEFLLNGEFEDAGVEEAA